MSHKPAINGRNDPGRFMVSELSTLSVYRISQEKNLLLRDFWTWMLAQPSKSHRTTPETTANMYMSYVKRLINEVPETEWNPERVLLFVKEQSEGLSDEAWNNWYKSIKKFDAYHEARGLPSNLSSKLVHITPADVEESQADPLTRAERDAIIRVAEQHDDEDMALWLEVDWDLMGRVCSDMDGFQWGWFDFKHGSDSTFDGYDGTTTFGQGKTGRGLKGYIWSPGLAEKLQQVKRRRKAKDIDYVFLNPEGRRGDLRRDTIEDRLKRYADEAGVRKSENGDGNEVHPHLIRAGAALELYLLKPYGMAPKEIMKMGRWRSIVALMRYLRISEGQLSSDLSRVRAIMNTPAITVEKVEPKMVAGGMAMAQTTKQKVILEEALETAMSEGWTFKAVLPSGKVVIEKVQQ